MGEVYSSAQADAFRLLKKDMGTAKGAVEMKKTGG